MHNGLSSVSRPVLRYHGGKWVLAPWDISHFPPHKIYLEPYGGAASVLLRKPRSYAEVYNDLDGELVNVFRVLRDPKQAAALVDALRLTPFARAEFEAAYEPSCDPVDQARKTMARCFMGFGSNAHSHKTGFRANSNRSGTTGAHDWAHFPDQIMTFCRRLAGVVLECRPALDIISQHDSAETLIYCDPPYPAETRNPGHDYNFEMDATDHGSLAQRLHAIRGMAIISGYPCELYNRLYGDWECHTTGTYADGARARTECLWLSPQVSERLYPIFRDVRGA